jgi:hypothetical protein
VKVTASATLTHNPWGEAYWASGLRENLTSRSYGEGLETGRAVTQVPRQSFTRQLVFKKMKQLLRLNQIRSTHLHSVEATVRGLLLAWALHEDTTTLLRTLLQATATATTDLTVVSSWLLSGLGLDTLRQQVQGSWSEARLQACLPRLHRFLCSRPRRRVHQESTVRAWLEQRARARPQEQRQAA